MTTLLQSANKASADCARHRHERGPAWKMPLLKSRADDLVAAYIYQSSHTPQAGTDSLALEMAIEEKAQPYAARRRDEQTLADYIGLVALHAAEQLDDWSLSTKLTRLATALMQCRLSGRMLSDGETLTIAWDYKCGQTRYCPDESRQAAKKLKNYYHKPMINFLNASPANRIFYSVFTVHNFELGQLRHGKAYLFSRYKRLKKMLKYYSQHACRRHAKDHNDLAEYAGAFCPARFVNGVSVKMASKKQIIYPPDPIRLVGDLAIQEDPMSALGAWNVHLNLFLLVNGACEFRLIRDLWGYNLFIEEKKIDGGDDSLDDALSEALKYAAEIVPTKSAQHAEAGARAPSMIEWNFDSFIEWFLAQSNTRRVRATGVLYKVHQKQWDAMSITERAIICHDADVPNLSPYTWDKIRQPVPGMTDPEVERLKKARNKIKARLREAMIFGEKTERGKCVGQIIFDDGVYRSVDLILERNFYDQADDQINLWRDSG